MPTTTGVAPASSEQDTIRYRYEPILTSIGVAKQTDKSRALQTQLLRFSITGMLNTGIDLLALNALLVIFSLHSTSQVLIANGVAYALGAVNSFILNKRWTFGRRTPVTLGEVGRFVLTTCAGIGVNDTLLWVIGQATPSSGGLTLLWANVAKVGAIAGTVLISFVGMRLWVFATRSTQPTTSAMTASQATTRIPAREVEAGQRIALSEILAHHSLSIVLPAYNEEQSIGATLADVTTALNAWGADYEVIVVNDGSHDHTGDIIAAFAAREPHVCVVTHADNEGYGAAVKSGFAAAANDLTFFMDSDGQFMIADLPRLLVQIDSDDAVLGYRIHRQDAPMRLLNAWGWKALVYFALGVRVRDLDCAYKLFRTDFLHTYPPTTSGALLNAELLFTLNRVGGAYREVGVRHLPRNGGRATGANIRVILRALRDLVRYTWRQRLSHGALPSSPTAQ